MICRCGKGDVRNFSKPPLCIPWLRGDSKRALPLLIEIETDGPDRFFVNRRPVRTGGQRSYDPGQHLDAAFNPRTIEGFYRLIGGDCHALEQMLDHVGMRQAGLWPSVGYQLT